MISCLLTGCNKYLAKIADGSLSTPKTLADVQLLLDNDAQTNRVTPGLGAVATDDIILDPASSQDTSFSYYGIYTWQPNLYLDQGLTDNSWSRPYKAIYYANVALHALDILPDNQKTDTLACKAAKGTGIFYRSFHFFNLTETFGQPYDSTTAAFAEGIPLRLDADAMKPVKRSSVGPVFDQIVSDLKEAASLLPSNVQRNFIFHPCRPAAWAMLARVLLVRQDYEQAMTYADSCLKACSTLLNYDTIAANPAHPFDPSGNPELLFQCSAYDYSPLYAAISSVDTVLYNSYAINDLRRTLYFQKRLSRPGFSFKGSYATARVFSGCSVDEVMLIRAECKARLKDVAGAMTDLNTLLVTRWKTGTFQPYTAATPDEALHLVLTERRKETPFRELRWSDLRRLRQDPRTAVTLKRILGGRLLTLPPNSVLYAWLIPQGEIDLSGIEQNPQR